MTPAVHPPTAHYHACKTSPRALTTMKEGRGKEFASFFYSNAHGHVHLKTSLTRNDACQVATCRRLRSSFGQLRCVTSVSCWPARHVLFSRNAWLKEIRRFDIQEDCLRNELRTVAELAAQREEVRSRECLGLGGLVTPQCGFRGVLSFDYSCVPGSKLRNCWLR